MSEILTKWWILIIVGFVLVAGGVFYMRGDDIDTNLPPELVNQMEQITESNGDPFDGMIQSQIAQYNIVSKQGKMPDTCAHAKTVAMLYLQKQDAANYTSWDNIATTCEQAYIKSQVQTQQ